MKRLVLGLLAGFLLGAAAVPAISADTLAQRVARLEEQAQRLDADLHSVCFYVNKQIHPTRLTVCLSGS